MAGGRILPIELEIDSGAAGVPVTFTVPEIVPSAARLGTKLLARLAGRSVMTASSFRVSPAEPVTDTEHAAGLDGQAVQAGNSFVTLTCAGDASSTGMLCGLAAKRSRTRSIIPPADCTLPAACSGLPS